MRIALFVVLAFTCLIVAPGCGPAASDVCMVHDDCVDDDPCTDGYCEEGTCTFVDRESCCAVAADCPASAIECEEATCVASVCGFAPIPACGPCDSDLECDDGDTCTEDACVEAACQNSPILTPECGACTSDAECDDGDPCTDDVCDAFCIHPPILTPECGPCESDADCDDLDACTTDSCDLGACTNAPIASCGTPTDLTVSVTVGPEGMAVIGPGGAPFSSPFLGLSADVGHVLVVGSSAGVSDVNLGTGAVSEVFSPFGAYSLDCYRAESGDYCAAPGPLGSYVLSTGLTTTDSSGNTTDAIASPPNAAGISAEVLYVQAGRIRARSTSFAPPRDVPATAFPGDAFPGQPTSGAWLDDDTVLVLFQNGEVWTAPLSAIGSSADATRVGDLGGVGASMRYLNCTPYDTERVCVATNFGESTGHVVHIEPSGVRFGPTFETGDSPVESDVRLTITGARFVSAGFADDEVRVHVYDGTAVTLEASSVLSSCDGPGHCAWVDDDTVAVTCNLSDTLRVVPRSLFE